MTREQQMQDMMTAAFWRDIEEGNQPDNGDAIEIAKTYERAYQQGWRDADQHPHWIPVEERLPKEKQKVLAYFSPNEKCDHEYACMALYNYGFHHWEDAEDPGVILEGVTHWMPIVPPRKQQD